MKEQTLGSTRIGCPRTKLTDKAKLSQIVHQFYTIWLKSNESKDYSVSLYKALNGIVSPTNAARLRNEGVARKMFVKTTNGKIRFRAGIAQPNEKMILSLIEENYGKEEKETFRSLLKDEEAIKEKLTQYMGKTEDVYNIGKSFVETMKDAKETTVAFYNKDSLNLFFAPTLPPLLDKNKEKEVPSKRNDALDMSKYENTYSLSHSEKVHTR